MKFKNDVGETIETTFDEILFSEDFKRLYNNCFDDNDYNMDTTVIFKSIENDILTLVDYKDKSNLETMMDDLKGYLKSFEIPSFKKLFEKRKLSFRYNDEGEFKMTIWV